MPTTSPNAVTVTGMVDLVTFSSRENGYAILKVLPDPKQIPGEMLDKHHRLTLVGQLAEFEPGLRFRATGPLKRHPKFGHQMEVQEIEILEPQSVTEIVRYLANDAMYIGPHYSRKIVEKFGAKTLEVIDQTPDRLLEIKGINKHRLENIKKAWADKRSVRDLLVFFSKVGLGGRFVVPVNKKWGTEAITKITADPYILARNIKHIGFQIADGVAMRMGIPEVSEKRLRAAAEFVLETELQNHGHCFLYKTELSRNITEFLAHAMIDEAMVTGVLEAAVHEKILTDAEGRIYLPKIWEAEQEVADDLDTLLHHSMPHELQGASLENVVQAAYRESGVPLSEEQKEAIRRSLSSKVSVITGGPGVGKTAITRAMVRGLKTTNLPITLLAPTGRASKRMTDVIGLGAQTCHRLLFRLEKAVVDGGGEPTFIGGIVIVDEVSMVDLKLMQWLLSWLSPDCVLILIGDKDQLPPVGPGAVLRDLLDSPWIPSTHLTHIFRQAQGSDIIVHSHSINAGQMPALQRFSRGMVTARGWPQADLMYVEMMEQPEQAKAAVWCATHMAKALGFDPARDVQVLSPMRKGEAGILNLNILLQQTLNPTPADSIRRPDGSLWGVGDRLMQLKNDYDYELFNGDQGIVKEFIRDEKESILSVLIDFEGRDVTIEAEDFGSLTLAYAMTVHKAQGSEFPMVVMCLHTGHFTLLQRNMLYTGITRSRKKVVLIANPQALSMAIHNNKVAKRNTYLAETLNALIAGEIA